MMRSELRRSDKGQTAIEFMIIFGAIFFFFISFMLVIQNNLADKTREAIDLSLNEIAFSVQDEIALAHSSSDGYYREFALPEKVLGKDYSINLTLRSVYLITEDERHSVALPVLNVTGFVQKGNNTIRKEDNEVYLNEEP